MAVSGNQTPSLSLDPARIDRFNPRWQPLPSVNYEAVPLANGWVGAAGWVEGGRLRFDLSHQDFWDFREPAPRDESQFSFANFKRLAMPYDQEKLAEAFHATNPHSSSRLPGIALALEGPSLRKLDAVTLKLRQGIARWSGALAFDARMDASRPWLVLEGKGSCPCVGGKKGELRISLRSAFDEPGSPVAKRLQVRGVAPLRVSPNRLLLIGESRTLGVELVVLEEDGRWSVVACVACLPTRAEVERDLDRQTTQVTFKTLRALKTAHTLEWRRLMSRSLVALPDKRIEALYWLEIYLLACMGRGNAPLMSLQGPWNFMDDWPAWDNDLHHNINVQMSYWSALKTGAVEYHEGLKAFLAQAREPARVLARRFLGRDGLLLGHSTDIRGQAPYSFPVGHYCWSSGLWLTQTLYQYTQYSGDSQALADLVLPWLKGSLRALLPELVEGEDGYLHLDCTFSPEYGGVGFQRPLGPDATIDLTFVRWAMEVLAAHAGDDPEVRAWEPLVARLVPPGRYPYVQFWAIADEAERPFMVRRDLPLETPHRHHSHLVSIFPLQQHDPRDPVEAELLRNNFKELMFRGHGEWVGFSFVWAAAIAAHARMPNPGLSLLVDYAERYATRNGWMVQGALNDLDFNTHCQNSWGIGVVTLEGPLAFPAAVLEMLLQDAHGRIEVFPAMPTIWTDAAFRDLLTCHGVKVGAELRQGHVMFVVLEFVRTGSCTLVNPWPDAGCAAASGGASVRHKERDIRMTGAAGDRWVFTPWGSQHEKNTRRMFQ